MKGSLFESEISGNPVASGITKHSRVWRQPEKSEMLSLSSKRKTERPRGSRVGGRSFTIPRLNQKLIKTLI